MMESVPVGVLVSHIDFVENYMFAISKGIILTTSSRVNSNLNRFLGGLY